MAETGIHHVTAIGGAAEENRRFHVEVLGRRLVKRTVNFDDPSTWHLYYGDRTGTPGTILTFFPSAGAGSGRPGRGEVGETAFRVPEGALDWWRHRLTAAGARIGVPIRRFGAPVLAFTDRHGMRLALEEGTVGPHRHPAAAPEIPADLALDGFAVVTLDIADPVPTASILTEVLGFVPAGTDGDRIRFETASAGARPGTRIDLRPVGGASAVAGRGSVHHVAFRAGSDAEQDRMADALRRDHAVHPTERRDRHYFRSIYFREPNGILFEIATDEPGFTADEDEAALGSALRLPPSLERRRAQIEAALPPLGP